MHMKLTALVVTTMLLPAAPAFADAPRWSPAYAQAGGDGGFNQVRYDRDDRRRYDRNGRYVTPQRVGPNDRVWRGDDGRYYCRRSNGTTGLIIGAAGGALAGRAIDTRGDRAVGTILGAAAGAVLGREIDRSRARCR